jgi:ADP-L-glycero-D-manno-heptose 6-epimerase
MNNRIVVTGAAGFIGRNVVEELNSRGYDDLILVDTLGTGNKWRNLLGLRYEDLITPDSLLEWLATGALSDIRSIIHLGACSATTELDADFLLRNNYRYSRTLCEWALKNNTRFVCASSAATYGDGALGYSDDDDVTPGLQPLNMYGYSKHMFDLWALKNHLFDRIVALKYFNVFGPYEDHKDDMRSVVSKSWKQISETGKVQLFKSYKPEFADGEQMRDFIYVKDAVAITLFFALDSQTGGLFNCGSGQARTWKDLVTAVYSAMGIEPKIEFIPMPEQLRGKYQYFTEADMSKTRAAGYTAPVTQLEDAVRDYIQNYYLAREK